MASQAGSFPAFLVSEARVFGIADIGPSHGLEKVTQNFPSTDGFDLIVKHDRRTRGWKGHQG